MEAQRFDVPALNIVHDLDNRALMAVKDFAALQRYFPADRGAVAVALNFPFKGLQSRR